MKSKRPFLTREEAEGFVVLGAVAAAAFLGGMLLGRKWVKATPLAGTEEDK
jgi:hypothetical protein